MNPNAVLAVIVLANVVTIAGGLVVMGRWFGKWFRHRLDLAVTKPLSELKVSMDDRLFELKKSVDKIEADVTTAKAEAARANDRLDKHLERHNA